MYKLSVTNMELKLIENELYWHDEMKWNESRGWVFGKWKWDF